MASYQKRAVAIVRPKRLSDEYSYMKKRRGINRILWAHYYSFRGLRYCLRHEAAFRQEFLLGLVVIPAIFLANLTNGEQALLCVSYLLILIVELLNTAIEKTIDRISLELHELSQIVKDVASAAVALSFIQFLGCVAIVFFLP